MLSHHDLDCVELLAVSEAIYKTECGDSLYAAAGFLLATVGASDEADGPLEEVAIDIDEGGMAGELGMRCQS